MSNVKYVKKEEKKGNILNYILIIFIAIMIISIIVMLSDNTNNKIKEVSYQEYVKKKTSDDYSIFLLAREGCSHCQQYKPLVNQVAQEKNLIVYYLDVDDLSEEEFYEVHDNIKALSSEYSDGVAVIPTPTTVIFKNNTEVISDVGNIGYDGFINLLKNSGVIR